MRRAVTSSHSRFRKTPALRAPAEQPGSAGQSTTAQACYLGGTGPVPTAGSGISPMQGMTASSAQFQGSPNDYGQQPMNGYGQQSTNDYGQQPTEYSTGQPDAGQASSQSAMSAGEIVTILQQEPDLVNSLRNALAQGFGIDPTTITDDGVYNCIRRDPNFRDEATAQLEIQGFIPSTPNRQQAPSRRIPTTLAATSRTTERHQDRETDSLSQSPVADRSLFPGCRGHAQFAAVRKRYIRVRHREREPIADGSSCRPRLCSWPGRQSDR